MNSKTLIDEPNPFVGPELEEVIINRRLEQISNSGRVVPCMVYDFHIPHPKGNPGSLPGPDEEGDLWDIHLRHELRPISSAVQFSVRIDLSRSEARRILRKIDDILRRDHFNWQDEFLTMMSELNFDQSA